MTGSAAEAYEAAREAIRNAVRGRALSLDLSEFRALEALPYDIAELTWITGLRLDGTQVADIARLQTLTALRTLWLDGTQVADIAPLQALTDLQELSLEGTQVADIAPLQTLAALRLLALDGTRVADLRPILQFDAIRSNTLADLSYAHCSACGLDPLGLGELAKLSLYSSRTEETLAYLRGLTDWPPPPPPAPEQDDVLRVALYAEGKLDIAPVHPSAEQAAERLRRTLYAPLRDAFAELERAAGNLQPEVSRKARRAGENLPEDIAEADLVLVYLDVDWARGEYDRRGERQGEERFSNAAVAALHKIVTIGPGIVLDNPDVEKLEDRRRRYADDPLSPAAVEAQAALAASIAEAGEVFGNSLRAIAAATAGPLDPASRPAAAQRTYVRNVVAFVGGAVMIGTITGPTEYYSLEAIKWLVANREPVLTAATGWGEMFLPWIGYVFEQAKGVLAAAQASGVIRPLPPRRKR